MVWRSALGGAAHGSVFAQAPNVSSVRRGTSQGRQSGGAQTCHGAVPRRERGWARRGRAPLDRLLGAGGGKSVSERRAARPGGEGGRAASHSLCSFTLLGPVAGSKHWSSARRGCAELLGGPERKAPAARAHGSAPPQFWLPPRRLGTFVFLTSGRLATPRSPLRLHPQNSDED